MHRIEEVWQRIVAHQGHTFRQKLGKEFTYTIKGHVVYPDGVNRHIGRKNFEKALARMPFETTSVLQDLQAPSYVYGVLKDPRICR